MPLGCRLLDAVVSAQLVQIGDEELLHFGDSALLLEVGRDLDQVVDAADALGVQRARVIVNLVVLLHTVIRG